MKRIQRLSAHLLPNAEQATEQLSASACSANTPKKVWYAPYKFEAYGEEDIAAVTSALRDGWLAPGPRPLAAKVYATHAEFERYHVNDASCMSHVHAKRTEEFERRVCQLFGKAHGIMVNSGSSGNIIGLAALGLEKGDEVITPACTFATVIAPLEQLGLKPVFIDVVPNRYVPTVDMVLAAITDRTKCIMIPNLAGSKIDWAELRRRVPSGIWLFEDSEQSSASETFSGCIWEFPKITGFTASACDADYARDSCDTITYTADSDVSVISFYASHIITAGGLGGLVMFNDEQLKRGLAAMVADTGEKLSRAKIRLPATATVWGLVVESSAYTKLVVKGLLEPYLSKAREFTGNEEGIFVARLVPPLSTCLLQHGTLKGRRHLSRLPLQDIYQFSDRLSALLVQTDAGDRFSVRQLEDVFGECPARDGLGAFQNRNMVFYRLNIARSDSRSAVSAVPSPQQQHLSAPAGSHQHQRHRTTVQCLLQKTMSAIDACDPAAARRALSQIESALDARCGTVTRTRTDPTSGEKKLIGGYTYLPKFLLDAVLMCDTLTVRHVYGFSIDSMHGDVSGLASQIQAAKEALLKMSGDRAARVAGVSRDLDAPASESERTMRWDHIKARLKPGKYYRMVLQSEGTAISFQCVCMHPERRSYVQRICCIGRDVAWFILWTLNIRSSGLLACRAVSCWALRLGKTALR
eukprot:s11_g19.t2